MTNKHFSLVDLQRWRLLLGESAESELGGLVPAYQAIDSALEWLYGRDPEWLARGERRAGLGKSCLTTPEWINAIHQLFPKAVIEKLELDAVERYGIDEVVTNLEVLERLKPSESLLRAVLQTKYLMNQQVLAAARKLVAEVVSELMTRLSSEIRPLFSGCRDRHCSSSHRIARNFDFKRTLTGNLQRWSPSHRKLFIEKPCFMSRVKRHTERWQLILLVDQSGSMVESVIHSAVMAACFWNLPGMETRLVTFDTEVVDLSADVSDPVELLMKVQLGGGTSIAKAVAYAHSCIATPQRALIVLITDFDEGGSSDELVRRVRACIQSGAQVLGLAALGRDATPRYNREMATRLGEEGMQIAAMTPGELATWLAQKLGGD